MAKKLDGIDELHDGIAVLLAEVAEFLHGPAGVALAVAVPHDGFDDVAGAAVVQTVGGAGADGGEAAAPQRGGAAPAGADVVLHVQLVLDHVGVGPYLLVGIARQTLVGGGEEVVGVGEAVVAGGPAGTVAGGAADLAKQLASPLHGRVVEVAEGGH